MSVPNQAAGQTARPHADPDSPWNRPGDAGWDNIPDQERAALARCADWRRAEAELARMPAPGDGAAVIELVPAPPEA